MAKRRTGKVNRWIALPAALVALAFVPASAFGFSAAVVGSTLSYTGSPGETNTVSLTHAGAIYTITDTTANATSVGTDCSGSGHVVTCSDQSVITINLDAGDMPDAVTVDPSVPLGATIGGAGGDDVLTGGNGADTLKGGPGNNSPDGRGGAD